MTNQNNDQQEWLPFSNSNQPKMTFTIPWPELHFGKADTIAVDMTRVSQNFWNSFLDGVPTCLYEIAVSPTSGSYFIVDKTVYVVWLYISLYSYRTTKTEMLSLINNQEAHAQLTTLLTMMDVLKNLKASDANQIQHIPKLTEAIESFTGGEFVNIYCPWCMKLSTRARHYNEHVATCDKVKKNE